MPVNATVSTFFPHRLLLKSCIAIMVLGAFFSASSFAEPYSRDLRAKQVNLIIRQIGDQLLIQAGNATSRVMPVTETKEGMFLLKFENDIVFNHDSLMALAYQFLPKKQFPSGYTITVHDCLKGEIVYGFQVNNTTPDILACKGRSQPAGCYTIEFAFPDFYSNLAEKKTNMYQSTEPVKVDPLSANPKSEAGSAKGLAVDSIKETQELKIAAVDPQRINAKRPELKSTSFNNSLTSMVCGGIVLILGVTLLTRRFGKAATAPPLQFQDPDMPAAPVTEMEMLGKLLFSAKEQHLVSGTEVISLTDKECKVLGILHKNFGELIPRETLMQEVWINEGVITGRSLDMFISKLRKKLSVDPDLRITNIHGRGYRLETSHEFSV